MRRLLLLIACGGAIAALVLGLCLKNARADPVVRTAQIALPDWPAGAPPQRIVLISDIHIGSVAMDQARLTRIVRRINALSPDLVLIAGDFVFGHDPQAARPFARALTRPLAGLRARRGVIAVLGNHDYWTQPGLIRTALETAGVTVLDNEAVIRGPLLIGGISDSYTDHDDIAKTFARPQPKPQSQRRARIALTHSPDVARRLPPSVALLLSGHTHCSQVVLPVWGPVVSVGPPRYRCGVVHDGGRTTIVTGGLGTSGPPLRYGAPPDLWLVTVGPPPRPASRQPVRPASNRNQARRSA